MDRKLHRHDSRYAAAFATLICAWALLLVALGLAAPLRGVTTAPAAIGIVLVMSTNQQRVMEDNPAFKKYVEGGSEMSNS